MENIVPATTLDGYTYTEEFVLVNGFKQFK